MANTDLNVCPSCVAWLWCPPSGRPPGPEMEYCTDRESYSLAAGLALGMVCLGVSQGHTDSGSPILDKYLFHNLLLHNCFLVLHLCLQHGSNLIGMTDLNVPEQLYQYMVGGHRRAQAGANRERHKSPSYQIKVQIKEIKSTVFKGR